MTEEEGILFNDDEAEDQEEFEEWDDNNDSEDLVESVQDELVPCTIYAQVTTSNFDKLEHVFSGCYRPRVYNSAGLPTLYYEDIDGRPSQLIGANLVVSIIPDNTRTVLNKNVKTED